MFISYSKRSYFLKERTLSLFKQLLAYIHFKEFDINGIDLVKSIVVSIHFSNFLANEN
jgi:hypothetical protein